MPALAKAITKKRRTSLIENVPPLHLRRHKNWMTTNGYVQDLSAYIKPAASPLRDAAGVILYCNWRQIETSQDTYSWAMLDAALATCKVYGKPMIIRLQLKSFTDQNDPPLAPTVPDYVLNDSVTYGGTTGRGGLTKSYDNSGGPSGSWSWVSWSTIITNSAVKARLAALVQAIFSRYDGESLVIGLMCDEIHPQFSTGTLPFGLTIAEIKASIKEYLTSFKAALGAKQLHVAVNYFDQLNASGAEASGNAVAIEMAQWVKANGMQLALTDVFYPGHPVQGSQPTYSEFASQNGGIAVVDFGDYYAADAGLSQRCIDMYATTATLYADITAWFPRTYTSGSYDPTFWIAAKTAFTSST